MEMGEPGQTVEIDESKFMHRKYHHRVLGSQDGQVGDQPVHDGCSTRSYSSCLAAHLCIACLSRTSHYY